MKKIFALFLSAVPVIACNNKPDALHLNGTWRLLSGTTITKGDTTVTDYTKDHNMIKVINDSHFAFLSHRVGEPKDSSNQFDAGGGSYTLTGDQYVEHLDFYGDKVWEGKTFTFTVSLHQDTLIQQGLEKVDSAGVNRVIIEKYVRVRQ
ncbi:MAG TPA: hypothetical protein VMI35_04585 [Puia sp.]|nr:hypothetical protein [Puia sp.]